MKFWSKKVWSKKIVILVSLMVLVAVVAALELTNTTYLFHDKTAVSGKIPTIATGEKAVTAPAKTQPKATDKPVAPAEATKPSEKSTGTAPGPTQPIGPLKSPYGTFVSNHSPSLSNPASLNEESVCNTTPGASCTITFRNNNGVVKTLASQTADSNGSTYWTWNVKDAGFTAGTWKVTATATANSESKSTADPINLEVKP